jgi:PBP1b-binding outer membrane lipoprotein LpoB
MVDVVASAEERGEIRQERAEQQSFASLESVKAMGRELGADLMLIGNMSSITDQSLNKRQKAVFYTVNMELIDIETNQKKWFGNKKIKKIVNKKGIGG